MLDVSLLSGIGSTGAVSPTKPASSAGFLDALRNAAATPPAPAAGSPVSLDGLPLPPEYSLDEWHDQFAAALREAGIELDEPVTLLSDHMGGWFVAGDHPQKAAIEEVLQGRPDLNVMLNGISGRRQLEEALRQHLEFAAAYERNPAAAVERYSYLFENETRAFSVTCDAFHAEGQLA